MNRVLSGAMFLTKVDRTAVWDIATYFSKPSRGKEGMFIEIHENELKIGKMPQKSVDFMRKNVEKSQQGFTELAGDNIKFAADSHWMSGHLVLVQVLMIPYVVMQPEFLIILRKRISLMVKNRKLSERYLEPRDLPRILQSLKDDGANGDSAEVYENRGSVGKKVSTLTPTFGSKRKNAENDQFSEKASISVKQEPPRTKNWAVSVVPVLTSANPEDTQCVMPGGVSEYANPMFQPLECKFPTQETTRNVGELSLPQPPRRRRMYPENLVTSRSTFRTHSEPMKYPDFASFDRRISTFCGGRWPKNKPQPNSLAEVGLFLVVGEGDLTRCFQCGIGFKDWNEDDDPLKEKVKHSPNCIFLVESIGRERIKALQLSINDLGRPLNGLHQMKSPRYQTLSSRIDSFKNFPARVNITPRQFAVAGLYYTGQNDLCRCFTCDGGLKTWDVNDDPQIEHARFFPQCPYINQVLSKDVIRSIQAASSQQNVTNGMGANGYAYAGTSNSLSANQSNGVYFTDGDPEVKVPKTETLADDMKSMKLKSNDEQCMKYCLPICCIFFTRI